MDIVNNIYNIKAEMVDHDTLINSSDNKENIKSAINWNNGTSTEMGNHEDIKPDVIEYTNNEFTNKNTSHNYLNKTGDTSKENIKPEVIPLDWNNGSTSPQEPTSSTGSMEQLPVTEDEDEAESNVKHEQIWLCPDSQYQENELKPTEAELKPKLKLNWSFAEHNVEHESEENPAAAPPRAYNYQHVYQEKKERALRQREEEERKAREFHSRPVPNFKALHKQLATMKVVHRITVPVTPETARSWRSRREQVKLQDVETVDAKLSRKIKLESKPFHLRAEQRVRERREFDASVEQRMALEKKEKEEQRKQQELEQQRDIRKMTEFKARPNPFK